MNYSCKQETFCFISDFLLRRLSLHRWHRTTILYFTEIIQRWTRSWSTSVKVQERTDLSQSGKVGLSVCFSYHLVHLPTEHCLWRNQTSSSRSKADSRCSEITWTRRRWLESERLKWPQDFGETGKEKQWNLQQPDLVVLQRFWFLYLPSFWNSH